ncbi:serine/threonine protein kinase [Pseudonocardia hierapolitana]|uniref:non-specific serine/threonine protein kinase n=1 Tax=Pseudonocardia hierapolitana TaxID=1128676 RepID=A0A561ST40_9PSEU|nr:serine/threonine-protein kinase [Pseudonocardia hierapolitana]TWF78019.1 serine/threonine protein kinase [Pseudonocardia hierapolitana]
MAPDEAAAFGDAPRVVAGRYELGPVLGAGSSAVVHRARDLRRGVEVAIKCFRPGGSERDLRQQRQEMALLARLDHPGLVRLHDGGLVDDCPFVVTDLVEGPTLAQRIASGPPLAPGPVRRLGAHLADALAYVHAVGIVHRDVKPANVLLGNGGRPRLADFGIARALEATAATADGCVVGTAAYLAPEQVRGERVAPATDVYALGLVLLEALTGRREYPGAAVESATARLYRSPAVPEGLPAGLSTVLNAMMQDDPRRRPPAAAVAAALSADPASPAASLALRSSARSRVVNHGRHRLGRPGTRPVSRIALAALTAIVAMVSVAAAPSAPRTAAADLRDPIKLSAKVR